MTVTKPKNESWIAGLWEHRVALGIAASASILMMLILVVQPGNKSASNKQHGTASGTEKQAAASKAVHVEQTRSGAPRYAIPDKSLSSQAAKEVAAAPVVRVITPSTPTEPAAVKRPAPAPAVKSPAAKPVVQTIAKHSSQNDSAAPKAKPVAKPASAQATQQDINAAAQIYFVQVGAFRERNSAQQQASMLLQKGWNSMVTTNAAGWYAVRIGPVSSRGAADKLRQQLLDKAKLKGFVVKG
ncbi:MAG: hypothetical protein AUJ58_02205 [Zetaproteobacteria bacterium CG1_02_55_237]|nr:MAG: hypothetical protein AUJ58_02205 [Zetaproteobacteria bacterium CG1_02_55_237]